NLFGQPNYHLDRISHSAHWPGCFLAKPFCIGTERCSAHNAIALPNESGGFYIWPLGQGEGEQNYESAEEPAPVEAVAVETPPESTTPATAALGPRSIKTRLISSHLHQRRSPRKICLPRRKSGTNPS